MIQWVVIGVLRNRDEEVLIAKRPEGKGLAGFWEFPGGKIEFGETPEVALCRELNEELGIEVDPEDVSPLTFLSTQIKDPPTVVLAFDVKKWRNTPQCLEHQDLIWMMPEALRGENLIPTNFRVVDILTTSRS